MKIMKFLPVVAIAVCAFASCKSGLSPEEITKKAEAEFATKQADLDAQAEKNCNDVFDATVTAEADRMADEKIAAEMAAAPSK